MLARHIDPGHFAIMIDHRAVMRCDDVILFVEAGVGPFGLATQRRHDLPEQPRAAIGAAADHHAIGAALRACGLASAAEQMSPFTMTGIDNASLTRSTKLQ